MNQIIQSLKTGATLLEQLPAPNVKKGQVLIRTNRSLVSLGTERMLVEFGKASLLAKAKQQPDKVKQVLNKIKTEGLKTTLEAVANKLDQPIPLGYCNVGEVVAVGEGVTEFAIGDRVASNGAHAEYVCVPKNLVAHIPSNVTDDEATFTVVGAIGLQGIRLINPTLGETIVVIGMGLIGMLSAQLLIANGCKVIGVDLDEEKLRLSQQWGVIPFHPKSEGDLVAFVNAKTSGIGCDGVLITASSKTNDIISQSAQIARKRGRIVLVGVVGLQLSRAEFYEKELSFQVSCSYGPGRYDDHYELKGQDYPLPFVRWTEKRNFETVLQALATSKLQVKEMISEVVPLAEYQKIYSRIGASNSIASILKYSEQNSSPEHTIALSPSTYSKSNACVGIIGAGNFTQMTLLPLLKKTNAQLYSIASTSGISSTGLAKKYRFAFSTTDYQSLLDDSNVNLVMITTRHNSHAQLVCECLLQKKHVFVEKPLAITTSQLETVLKTYQLTEGKYSISVGFNRRFSPHSQKIKAVLGNLPMNIIATVNAGSLPPTAWVHDRKVGGGRIIGEACHFIDLITYLTGSLVSSVCMNAMELHPQETSDNATILLKYKNGSTGVINYFSNGSKAYPKERIEIYSQERTAIIDNFRKTKGYGFKGFSSYSSPLDKGHKNQLQQLVQQLEQGTPPIIPFEELINTTQATLAAIESLKNKQWITLF